MRSGRPCCSHSREICSVVDVMCMRMSDQGRALPNDANDSVLHSDWFHSSSALAIQRVMNVCATVCFGLSVARKADDRVFDAVSKPPIASAMAFGSCSGYKEAMAVSNAATCADAEPSSGLNADCDSGGRSPRNRGSEACSI